MHPCVYVLMSVHSRHSADTGICVVRIERRKNGNSLYRSPTTTSDYLFAKNSGRSVAWVLASGKPHAKDRMSSRVPHDPEHELEWPLPQVWVLEYGADDLCSSRSPNTKALS